MNKNIALVLKFGKHNTPVTKCHFKINITTFPYSSIAISSALNFTQCCKILTQSCCCILSDRPLLEINVFMTIRKSCFAVSYLSFCYCSCQSNQAAHLFYSLFYLVLTLKVFYKRASHLAFFLLFSSCFFII